MLGTIIQSGGKRADISCMVPSAAGTTIRSLPASAGNTTGVVARARAAAPPWLWMVGVVGWGAVVRRLALQFVP